jgi:hypothetical protein
VQSGEVPPLHYFTAGAACLHSQKKSQAGILEILNLFFLFITG